jgi:hydrogenase 3 maturation protease
MKLRSLFRKFPSKLKLRKGEGRKGQPQPARGREDEEHTKNLNDIFRAFAEKPREQRFAFLGIGNDLKGDDGVGWHVVDRLAHEFAGDSSLLFIKTAVPENHVKEIREFSPSMLIIVDAADFRQRPGAIKYIREYQIKESFVSTHTTPLTLFLRLYQADRPVKGGVTIIGIQKKNNEFGQPMSVAVRGAGDRLAELVAELYRQKTLYSSLETELGYLANPLKKISDRIRKK